jgi:hypothetical protein
MMEIIHAKTARLHTNCRLKKSFRDMDRIYEKLSKSYISKCIVEACKIGESKVSIRVFEDLGGHTGDSIFIGNKNTPFHCEAIKGELVFIGYRVSIKENAGLCFFVIEW